MQTSQSFSDQTEERRPCPHGKMVLVVADGRLRLSECPECCMENEQRKKEATFIKERIARKYEISAEIGSKVPKRFVGKKTSNYIAKTDQQKRVLSFCEKYISNFETVGQQGVSIVFCGKPGTGKTHLSYAIANEIGQGHLLAVVKTASDITSSIKAAYRSDEPGKTPEYITSLYTETDLLVIDEVGVQVSSEAEKRIFFDVMNKRYEDMKPTILVSNLSKDELTEFIGERVMDRLKEGGGVIFAFDWESYR